MSDSSCGVSSCGSNISGINEGYRMAGSSGSCSFIKQERIENDSFATESRSSGDIDRHKEDSNDELQNEKVGKIPNASSPQYQKLNKKSSGQLSHQQPDSQSSNNNNNSIKTGKKIFYITLDLYAFRLLHSFRLIK